MSRPKFLTKEDVLIAQSKTRSNRAAARYLHVSYGHYKQYAKLYKDEETGKTLFETHLNPSGKGIPKLLRIDGKEPGLWDILDGKVPVEHFTPEKIKQRLLVEGLLEEVCTKCGFSEKRILDLKAPLILRFKDGNKKNYSLNNIELLCYNCYFLYIDNIFSNKQIESLEDYHTGKIVKEPTWELEDYQIEHLKELGLIQDNSYISGSEFIVPKL
jgi:hypothetical protein